MGRQTRQVGLLLLLLGMFIGAHYVLAAGDHREMMPATATAISPMELTLAAKPLPVTFVESYF